jgi:hypothetical protein
MTCQKNPQNKKKKPKNKTFSTYIKIVAFTEGAATPFALLIKVMNLEWRFLNYGLNILSPYLSPILTIGRIESKPYLFTITPCF